MRTVAVRDDVTLSGCQNETPAVAQLGDKLAVDHMDDVPALAPVICEIAGRVFDDPDAYIPNLSRSPVRDTMLTQMLGARDARPVDRLKRRVLDLHEGMKTTGSSGVIMTRVPIR